MYPLARVGDPDHPDTRIREEVSHSQSGIAAALHDSSLAHERLANTFVEAGEGNKSSECGRAVASETAADRERLASK